MGESGHSKPRSPGASPRARGRRGAAKSSRSRRERPRDTPNRDRASAPDRKARARRGRGNEPPAEGSAESKHEPPKGGAFLLALGGVALLCFVGGGRHPSAHAIAALLAGVALMRAPAAAGFGRVCGIGFAGFAGVVLLAFMPSVFGALPDWRTVAAERHGIGLPSAISARPLVSAHGALLVFAGIGWLYAVGSWSINHGGRKRFFAALSGATAVAGAWTLLGAYLGWDSPASPDGVGFAFTDDRSQTGALLGLGGIASFALTMEGLKKRRALNFWGAVATLLALGAIVLTVSAAGMGIFFGGATVWFFLRVGSARLSRRWKASVLLLAAGLLVRVGAEAYADDWFADAGGAAPATEASLAMAADHPVTGAGLGLFEDVFPLYRASPGMAEEPRPHPGNDALWTLSEVGWAGAAFLAVAFAGLLGRCAWPLPGGREAPYRLAALAVVATFVGYGGFGVGWHRPGAAFAVILLAGVALPAREATASGRAAKGLAKVAGGALVLVGMLWLGAATLDLPAHPAVVRDRVASRVAEARASGDAEAIEAGLTRAIDWNPLGAQLYFERGRVRLNGPYNREGAAKDFERARFLAPSSAEIAFREGVEWVAFDPEQTRRAWSVALERAGEQRSALFERMLRRAAENPFLMEPLKRIADGRSDLRYRLLMSRGEEAFHEAMEELARDGGAALERFAPGPRARLLRRWIQEGRHEAASEVIRAQAERLPRAWMLRARVAFQRGDLDGAVDRLLENIPEVALPTGELTDRERARLDRSFRFDSIGMRRAGRLVRERIRQGQRERALKLLQEMASDPEAPAYVHYWRGVLLDEAGRHVDAWDALQQYLRR